MVRKKQQSKPSLDALLLVLPTGLRPSSSHAPATAVLIDKLLALLLNRVVKRSRDAKKRFAPFLIKTPPNLQKLGRRNFNGFRHLTDEPALRPVHLRS